MPKFIFQLQPVLRQREAIERRLQLATASVESERAALESMIRGYHEQSLAAKRDWREQLGEARRGAPVRADIRGARFQAGTALMLVARAQHAVVKLAGVHKRLERARAELLEASRRRRAVELLREKRLEAWKAEQRRLETAALDEINTARAAAPREDA